MINVIQEFLVVTIIVFSINMIYFYFKNKSKKYRNIMSPEMYFLTKLYNIDINSIGKSIVERDISIVNSIIITIDLLIYYHIKNLLLAIIIIGVGTFLLIGILYTILGKIYVRKMYRR